MNILDMKGCDYVVVDVNTDVNKYTSDMELLTILKDGNFLYMDEVNPTKPLVPQVLFDGISVGNHIDLQELEDDGLLDGIMDGVICPACKQERAASTHTTFQCANSDCGYSYMKLVTTEDLAMGRYLVLRSRYRVNEEYQQQLQEEEAAA